MSGFRFIRENLRRLNPPRKSKVNPFDSGIASDHADAAIKWKLDGFRRASRVGNVEELSEAAVQLLHVESIGHRNRVLHDRIARWNDHGRICNVGMSRADLQDLRSRRTLVSRQKKFAAME